MVGVCCHSTARLGRRAWWSFSGARVYRFTLGKTHKLQNRDNHLDSSPKIT